MMDPTPNNLLNTTISTSHSHSRSRHTTTGAGNNTSHTRSSHASASLSRRRLGLLHAQGNLSRRKLQPGERSSSPPSSKGGAQVVAERRPTLPIRELSNPSLVPSSYHSRKYVDQDCSIPSLELKIQTLLNLEGREFLHSSINAPIPPCREPSVIPSSGHSRSTIPLEDQDYPTTLPDANRKQQTLNGSYLHASTNCPIQPVREPSVAGSLGASSYHSGASGYSMTSTIATNPTTYSKDHMGMPSLSSIPQFRICQSDTDYCTSGDEDEDIFSEEETETETDFDECAASDMDESIYYDDIKIDYPLLGPTTSASSSTLGPLATSTTSTCQPPLHISTTAPTNSSTAGLPPNTASALALLNSHVVGGSSSGSIVDSVEADELRALKQYWADLGERIDAMEARTGIKNSLTDLGLRLDALKLQTSSQGSGGLGEGRMSEKPLGLGPAPGDRSKSKSKSRSSSSAKSAPAAMIIAAGDSRRGRSKGRRGGTDRSVSTTRSQSVGAGERPRRSTAKRSSRRRSKQSSTTGVDRSSTTSTTKKEHRTKSSRRSSTKTSSSLASSKRHHHDDESRASRRRRRSSSGQRKLVQEGDLSDLDESAPSPMSSSSSNRRRGSSRRLADATDSVDLRRSSATTSAAARRGSKSPRSSMKDISSKSENDIIIRKSSSRASMKDDSISKSENDIHIRKPSARSSGSCSRMAAAAMTSSPGARSTASATARRPRRVSHHRRSSSASGTGSMCSMPALLGDLDAISSNNKKNNLYNCYGGEDSDIHDTTDDDGVGAERNKKRSPPNRSPRDTMDVNWWKFQHEQHVTSNRSLPVSSTSKEGRMQQPSRLGKN